MIPNTVAANFALSPDQVERLATAFAGRLAVLLTGKQWEGMRKRNALSSYAWPVCASHDYMDANDVMAAAFVNVMGRGFALRSDVEAGRATEAQHATDLALWNAAWTYAKGRYLTAEA
jgi:hypothetical protein